MKTQATTSKRRMPKFAAGLVALSLAISGAAAVPARASDQDVARIIGGLATLFIVGKAIENSKSKSKKVRTEKRTIDDSGSHPRRDVDRFGRSNAFDIPNACVVSLRGRHDRIQTVAMESCVMHERRSAVQLPRACETRVLTKRGRKEAYDVGCLNNFGYRVTRSGGRDGHRALR